MFKYEIKFGTVVPKYFVAEYAGFPATVAASSDPLLTQAIITPVYTEIFKYPTKLVCQVYVVPSGNKVVGGELEGVTLNDPPLQIFTL